ncbi:hypothetical protein LOTGIDRAFT_171715 [Lottia gigantea]|uniref:Sushi domain-containing protein n=1 Tax=Lottia gigantea TaxID=225164 RepID=V4CLE1_LOTGI|nr:hypothetical protein LOTGIDRAFT_171715 [Lottia gigantea]ESP03110.1 hypothetical protein LOTGIDRAFT_171715 [Lottia gigantea]
MATENYESTTLTFGVISSSEFTENILTCSVLAIKGGYQSFFYHQQNHQCILQSEKIHVVSDLSVSDGYRYLVQDGPTCGPPPTLENGQLVSVSQVNGDYVAEYSCNTGFYFSGPKTSTCSGGIWSTGMNCKCKLFLI